jgi:hypothetical protein
MKKFALFTVVLLLSVSIVPAIAGGGPILYGVVVGIAGPYGPVSIEGMDGTSFEAWPVDDVPLDKLYLGCEVSAQLDFNGKVYLANITNETENQLQKISWITEILDYERNSSELIISTPIGPERLFDPHKIIGEQDAKNGSQLIVKAFRSPWKGHFIVISARLIAR